MNRKHSEEQKRTALELVTSKTTTVREAAVRVGVSYSTATRWVHQSRTRALVPTKPARQFAQLVREMDLEAVIHVRVGRAEIHEKLDAGKFELPRAMEAGQHHLIVSDAIFDVIHHGVALTPGRRQRLH